MPVYAFYTGDPGWRKGWRDKLIRWATGHPASHVEYVVGGVLGKSNVCISASKRDGNRVRSKPITWKPDNWVFVEVEGDDKAIYKRMIAECGKPYDTLGAVMSVTPFSRHKVGAWFCNELAGYGLGIQNPHRGTPGSFFNALTSMGGRIIKIEAHERMNRVNKVAQQQNHESER